MITELTDAQWEKIEYYLPPINQNGRPRANDRAVINGILYVLKTGCQWNALPEELFGVSDTTCWRRLKHWHEEGVWLKIADILLEELDIDLDEAAIDTAYVKAKKGGVTSAKHGRVKQPSVAW